MLERWCFFSSRYVQVGIISWGIACGKKNIPGIYANVPNALPFIAWDNYCHYKEKYSSYTDFPQHNNWIEQEIKELRFIPGAGKYIRRAQKMIRRNCPELFPSLI